MSHAHEKAPRQQAAGAVEEPAKGVHRQRRRVEDEGEGSELAHDGGQARDQNDLDREGERAAGDIGHEIEKGRAPHPGLQGPGMPVVLRQVAGQHDDGDVGHGAKRLDHQHVPAVAAAEGDPADEEEQSGRAQQERTAGGAAHASVSGGTPRDGATRLPGTPSDQRGKTVSAAVADVAKARRKSGRKRIGVTLRQHT